MKRIISSDLPQADRLESVLLTVIAVGNGALTDIEIADRIPSIEGDDRQGRYYRNAAEMLGFIVNRKNNATLTPKGQELLNDPVLTNPFFISSVLNLEVYQKLLPYLELHPEGLTRQEIESYLQSIANPQIGPSMIPRRISTILTWPRTLGFLVQNNSGQYQIRNNLSGELPVFEIQDIDQPLLPVTGDLSEYQEISNRTEMAKDEVVYFKDQAKLEKSINAHITLVNLVAQRIRENGGMPKSNQLIDLAVRFDRDYIFEMKSTNDDNVRSQVRKGMSQLYEYRYLQNKPRAKLILVIEKPLGASHSWMLDYMESDREIHLVWDGNEELYGSKGARNELGFLGLQP
ncbi:MAG: hypothetical protein KAU06_10210 [Candidatus Marinimicrobia bacterium]|nr:hypothetical protein [Candidatus Neomarinimicrobiota bacterium]